jgi:hypothetical protein
MPEPITTAEIIGDALYEMAGGDGAPHDGPSYESQARAVLAALAQHGHAIVPASAVAHLDQIQALAGARAVAESWRDAAMSRAQDMDGTAMWAAVGHVCAMILSALNGDPTVVDANGQPVASGAEEADGG